MPSARAIPWFVAELPQTQRLNGSNMRPLAGGGSVMKQLFLGSVALLALAAASSVDAADMPARAPVYKAPVAEAAYNWTGFYVGANGGYGWGDRNVGFSPNDPSSASEFSGTGSPALPNANFDVKGGFGGVQLGYNWLFASNWLAGIEADFDLASIKGSGTSPHAIVGQGTSLPGTATVSEKTKWFGTARLRLGSLITPGLLVYGTGGFAYGRVAQDADYVQTVTIVNIVPPFAFSCTAGTPCFAGSSSKVRTGWTVGAGAEWALWNSLTFKIEYLYVNLGDNAFPMTATATEPGFTPASINVDFGQSDFHSVRAGLNYKFDWGKGPVAGKGPVVTRY